MDSWNEITTEDDWWLYDFFCAARRLLLIKWYSWCLSIHFLYQITGKVMRKYHCKLIVMFISELLLSFEMQQWNIFRITDAVSLRLKFHCLVMLLKWANEVNVSYNISHIIQHVLFDASLTIYRLLLDRKWECLHFAEKKCK